MFRPTLLMHLNSRLKKVQAKKKRNTAAAEEERKRIAAEAGEDVPAPHLEELDEGGEDLLSTKDNDVIF